VCGTDIGLKKYLEFTAARQRKNKIKGNGDDRAHNDRKAVKNSG
jgi:hypothetical protein